MPQIPWAQSDSRPTPTRRAVLSRTVAGAVGVAGVATAISAINAPPADAAALPTPDWFNVTASPYNADPTGATDSTAAFNQAISAAQAVNGVLYMPTGKYKLTAGSLKAITPPMSLRGDGPNQTILNFNGAGDGIRYQNSTYDGTSKNGGFLQGFTLDGTGCGTSMARGLHLGDGGHIRVDEVWVQNFTGTNSIGFHFDNAVWWTEKLHGRIFAQNCTSHVVFDITTSPNNSFGYADLEILLNASANQDGVVLQNGALFYHGKLSILGNMAGSNSVVSNACLRITGQQSGHSGPDSYSRIHGSEVNILVEAGSNVAFNPYSIYFGATSAANRIDGCHGTMNFWNSFANSNVTISTNADTLLYIGNIFGDPNLAPASNNAPGPNAPIPTLSGGLAYAQAWLGPAGAAYTMSGDFFYRKLGADLPISLNPTGQLPVTQGSTTTYHTVSAPQRKTFIITQPASQSYTVTWPSSSSPSTSSPNVVWPSGDSGSAPAQGTTDMYELTTLDGATWYGTHYKNYPVAG